MCLFWWSESLTVKVSQWRKFYRERFQWKTHSENFTVTEVSQWIFHCETFTVKLSLWNFHCETFWSSKQRHLIEQTVYSESFKVKEESFTVKKVSKWKICSGRFTENGSSRWEFLYCVNFQIRSNLCFERNFISNHITH